MPHILRLKYLFAHYLYPTASPSSLLKMAPRLHIPKRLEDMSFPADEILLAVFFLFGSLFSYSSLDSSMHPRPIR